MNSSPMSYREAAPSEDVRHLVFSFWEFTTAEDVAEPLSHEIFPDGCISLFYRRNARFNIHFFALSGLNLESVTVPVLPGDIFWGMRLSPAAAASLLREDPAKFAGQHAVEADEFSHLSEGLLEKLKLCEDFDEAVRIYEDHLRGLRFGRDSADETVARALALIEESSGEMKIHELAARLDLSRRQLERRFKKASGLSPKQFARSRRLRAAAVDLVENNGLSWANRAAEMGFADQSHLTHEFVAVTKRSPNSFAEKVRRIKHGKLVK